MESWIIKSQLAKYITIDLRIQLKYFNRAVKFDF